MKFQSSLLAFAWAICAASPRVSGATVRRYGQLPPSQDPFYLVPENILDYEPGQIIRIRQPQSTFSAFNHTPNNIESAHQILYRTTDNIDDATATVTTVFVPKNANMSQVLSFQVAEDAASIDCAPSFGFLQAVDSYPPLISATMSLQLLLVQAALDRGWVVLVPDFQGPLGAYGANKLAAHAVLDGIQAAIMSSNSIGIEPDANVVLWGYSGGASVTQTAAEMQPNHAPQLKLSGAAIGGLGPGNASAEQILELNEGFRVGLLASALVGLANQYDDFRAVLDEQLYPDQREKFYSPLDQCLEANLVTFNGTDLFKVFKDVNEVFTAPVIEQIVRDNQRGATVPETPMLWYQATLDDIADISIIDASVEDNCARGAVIEYIRDAAPNLLHRNYGIVGASAALEWLQQRLEGEDPPRECVTNTISTPNADPELLSLFPPHIVKALTDLVNAPVAGNVTEAVRVR